MLSHFEIGETWKLTFRFQTNKVYTGVPTSMRNLVTDVFAQKPPHNFNVKLKMVFKELGRHVKKSGESILH